MNKPDTSYRNDPDIQLMLAFQNGDIASFEKLLVKYFPRILNFIYRYLQDRSLSEDLTQEVFIRIYKSKANYKPQSKFTTWAFTIAKNLSLNELRRRKRPTFSMNENLRTANNQINRQFEDVKAEHPDEHVLKQERSKAVQRAISELPANQRTAVLLFRYEQFSYDAIAQTMNLSVKAIKSLLSRARENLKNKLNYLINED